MSSTSAPTPLFPVKLRLTPAPALLTRRFEAQLHWQPVVKVTRRTETGEAPRRQGATTENIAHIRRRSNAARADASPVECSVTFTTGC